MAVDDLEREVDFASTDDILDELRAELGLPTVGPTADAENGATSSEAAPGTTAGSSEPPGTDDGAPARPLGRRPSRTRRALDPDGLAPDRGAGEPVTPPG